MGVKVLCGLIGGHGILGLEIEPEVALALRFDPALKPEIMAEVKNGYVILYNAGWRAVEEERQEQLRDRS